ncbi:hypothetical protein K458DRAFT_439887 [Lentithecium fluviatile CBS 122367]|uniref:Rhodopsin domain-containing protein n=1 Tax=Lentithecium fluviatile CBS 122367 TaxID=1168545 RepID=A0A6G1JGF0_9PLEO|nr:hypothetical protein K458DRAFT_439887 [Lentithecium fluviatile CBS 122367]
MARQQEASCERDQMLRLEKLLGIAFEANYVDPETRRPLALAVIIPMTALVITFISCRFYSRSVLIYALGWDDWTMLLAAILSVGNNMMIVISMLPKYQMGYHLWDIRPKILYGAMKAAQMGMATQLLFTAIITLMEVPILLTYLRIFPSRMNKWFCRIMLVYTISLNVSCFFVTLFQCSQASTYWEIFKYIGKTKCLGIGAIYYFHSSQNMFSDFIIFVWPAKDLLNAQISFRQRVTLICMFSMGVIVFIADIVRVYFTHLYLISYNVFWHGDESFIIISVESGVGFVCGCLPGCQPLMNRMFPRVFADTFQSSSYPRPSAQNQTRQLRRVVPLQQSGAPEQGSYQIRSLGLDGSDVVLTKTRRDVHYNRPAPPRPSQSQRGLTSPSQVGFSGNRASSKELDAICSASTELMILQQASVHSDSYAMHM